MRIRRAKPEDIPRPYRMARNDLGRYSQFNRYALMKNVKEEGRLCFVLEHEKLVDGTLFFRQEWNGVVWGWLIFLEKHMRQKF